MGGTRGDVDIVNVDRAVGDTGDSTYGMKQSGFADARGAGDCECFAGGNSERDVVNNDGVVECNGKIRNVKHDS